MFKNFLSSNNLIFICILGVFILTQAPTIADNFKSEGKSLNSIMLTEMGPRGELGKIKFPPKGRAIALFWATTCGPCKVEMARLKSSVNGGKIPKTSIFALNTFESAKKISSFLKRNNYPFTFLLDPGLGKVLNVRATPTTLFLEDGKVISMKSGMSLTGIWSAERFIEQ